MQRRRQRRRPQRRSEADGSIASAAAAEGSSSVPGDNSQVSKNKNSHEGKQMRYSEHVLPEDILSHIHSLLPLRDAARAACVSHAFLNSWRRHPNLYFSVETLGLEVSLDGDDKICRDFTRIVYHILKKHSGSVLKTFQLDMCDCNNVNSCHLDNWLHLALTLGIEELILETSSMTSKYNFPVSLLSSKSGKAIRYLYLNSCAFRPTVRLSCFKSLKRLHLCHVSITGDELQCLLLDSLALEQLELAYCREIICLKMPCVLLRLSYLEVTACYNLEVIESEAPNLSTLYFGWFNHHVPISLGEALHVKKVEMSCFRAFDYSQLPTIMPNLESLTIVSLFKITSAPCATSKFRRLKYLSVGVPGEASGPAYDYLSLGSFLGASPCLETFILHIHVLELRVQDGLFSGDPSQLRQTPDHRHEKLKRVQIAGFYPAKSILELACYVLETATSLECFELGTNYCPYWFHNQHADCYLVAIRTYIEAKVPSTVRLDVQGPCTGSCGFNVLYD